MRRQTLRQNVLHYDESIFSLGDTIQSLIAILMYGTARKRGRQK